MSKFKKASLIVLVVLVVIYAGGAYLFSKYSYPNTKVNDKSRGFVPIGSVIHEPDTNAQIKVQARNNDIANFTGNNIDLSIEKNGDMEVTQNFLLWPYEIFRKNDYKVDYHVDYDENKLANELSAIKILPNGPMPKDAKVEADDNGAFVKKEDEGNHLAYSELKNRIIIAFLEGSDFVTAKDLYAEPKVRQDDPALNEEADKLNKILKLKVEYKFGDKIVNFGPKEMLESLDRSEEGSYTINKEKVAKWVQNLANKTDTYGKKREFITHAGKKQTIQAGIYGWKMDVKKTTEELYEMVNKGGHYETEPVYKVKAKARGELNDIGDNYIEIDLSKQTLWCYKDKKMVFSSKLKSGKVNGNYETPIGAHKIWSREKDKKLTGRNLDGSEYNSEVKYWIPINYGGVGLHDADWVKYFGGNNYINNGSHGCINLPIEAAEFIFNNFPVGTPVPTYESTTNYSPADKTF